MSTISPPTAAAPSSLELLAGEERRTAARALLAEQLLDAEHPAYALARRHEQALARRFSDLLGYRLELAPGFARLVKRPTEAALRRPLRIRPGSASGRARARDDWPALDRRRAVLLMLALAALERSGQQTVVGELARAVADAGGRCEPPIAVDFEARAERLALADVLDFLVGLGVIAVVDGSRRSFACTEPAEDEALFTIDRRRLASLVRDPFRAVQATGLDDLLEDAHDYAPTPEGENRRLRHRLARRLVEDPVLYLDRLTQAERAYFATQRGYLESGVVELLGLDPERRAEGTACIERGRELTDVAFPANSTVKQAALLLCEPLSAAREAVVPHESLRRAMRGLVRRHGASWNRAADDPGEVETLLEDALAVLESLDLIERAEHGARPLALCARFRAPRLSTRDPEA